MRVTQSMLSNSNLKYISQNYNRLGKIQDQINTGKKITKPSDDPVVAMKGMRYRSQLVEVKQFKRNLDEAFNWMENSDAALEESGKVIHRIRELAVQASNDSYDPIARQNISKEIERLQEHLVALAESKVGDNYIFNGTNTSKSPINTSELNVDFQKFISNIPSDPEKYVISYKGQTYKYAGTGTNHIFVAESKVKHKNPTYDPNNPASVEYIESPSASFKIGGTPVKVTHTQLEAIKDLGGEAKESSKVLTDFNNIVLSKETAVSTNPQDVRIEVLKGVTIPINVRPQQAFPVEMFSGIESIRKMLTDPTTQGTEITKAVDSLDVFLNNIISTRAELGAQVNRTEMVYERLMQQEVIAEKTVSDNEDVDFEKAIIDLTIQETLHRAALAAGARIIQPTLMDFLR